ncbi:cytochrome P450 [Mycena albidolilacea]|uniref:Cytochrome P450 n=1 Tax=Mycena albidolilacea TaxID=1033008 RepID=A0AAD6YZS9_9AGAR|nr:cytochrome P450 [Mycena albidolilacea]
MSLALHCFVAFIGGLCFLVILCKKQRSAILPPGPPGDPLVGHLLRMPATDSALIFHEWSKTYGEVMHLEVLGRTMIILDSYRAAVDILDKRGSIYSDRPKFIVYELVGWKPALAFLQYGKQYNKHRQMHQSYLSRHKAEDFKSMQTQEARTLVRNLIESTPDKYEKFLSRFATGIITQIVAGHRITSNDDPYLRLSDMIAQAITEMGPPGGSPLDFFPILQHFPPWFPGAHHVGVVRAWRSTMQELYDYPLRAISTLRPQLIFILWQKVGEALPSFILAQLEQTAQSEDDEDLKGAAAAMFAAGESTTWGTLAVFVLAMILHPECQAKAQKEIDSVVGDLRLPDFKDRGNLPFVECILQETLRWNPALPLGVPHRVMEDDVYRGMFIPKGSLVFANIRGMSLDEAVYSDPKSFFPERFLPKPAGKGEPHFSNVAFGFGRRICSGQYVADNSVWIAISSILASSNISNALDENGHVIVPESKFTDGLVKQVISIAVTPNHN